MASGLGCRFRLAASPLRLRAKGRKDCLANAFMPGASAADILGAKRRMFEARLDAASIFPRLYADSLKFLYFSGDAERIDFDAQLRQSDEARNAHQQA